MQVMIGLLIPFLGTTLGAATVFLMKNEMNKKVEKILLGFASGVMIAAAIWSLIIPSIDMAEEQGKVSWIPAAIGFLLGMVFLLILDHLIPHLHLESDKPEGIKSKLKKTTMMVFAVTLHNIPEGMAVGVTFAGAILGNTGITIAGAMALAIRNRNTKLSGGGYYFYAIKK
jgi:ZIP family zinc transporter